MADQLSEEVKSLRHDILKTIVDTFAAVSEDDYGLKFSLVELGPLGNEDFRKRYTMGVVPGPEKYSHVFPYIERALTVGLEFRVTVNRDDEKPGVLAERLLTIVERVILENETWSGLALDTNLQNNEIDITTYGDKSVQGVLFIQVRYRHAHGDPRNHNPDV